MKKWIVLMLITGVTLVFSVANVAASCKALLQDSDETVFSRVGEIGGIAGNGKEMVVDDEIYVFDKESIIVCNSDDEEIALTTISQNSSVVIVYTKDNKILLINVEEQAGFEVEKVVKLSQPHFCCSPVFWEGDVINQVNQTGT